MNVAIIGRPNVGKSALFNRLVGRKIAIVHDQPGITRDRLYATCNRGTQAFTVFDTGGIVGAGESELIAEVQRIVRETIHQSDLLILVVDGKAGLTPIDHEIARVARKSGKRVILAVNKIDSEKEEHFSEFHSLGVEPILPISAEHNRGISDLLDEIERLLPEISGHPSAVRARPIAIAIIGRPNVGKSSLINSIVKDERAIVSELPGTTRDAIHIQYERGDERLVFIDTAGIRRRGKHSTSVEVFSVMRAERSIREADLCVLTVDVSAGVTAQDKRIAGLIQEAQKACAIVLNKWDLIKPGRNNKRMIQEVLEQARDDLFFVDYAPVVVASAKTGDNVERLFGVIKRVREAARRHIGTGLLNRLLRAAFAANPPPLRKGKRLKLFYGTQSAGPDDRPFAPPEFVLFVNDPRLLTNEYERYLIARIRDAEPFEGLPILLTLRPRQGR